MNTINSNVLFTKKNINVLMKDYQLIPLKRVFDKRNNY